MPADPALPKLIIQIPCYDEEQTIGATLAELPRTLPGIGSIEWLIINDGSRDRTIEAALAAGADHVVDLGVNRGLARAFMAGLECAVELGADIIVNTDADNQYPAADIPLLLAPILERRAQFVVGDRPIGTTEHFSAGSSAGCRRSAARSSASPRAPTWATRRAAFARSSREAAMRIHVFDNYTYTLELLIQAGTVGHQGGVGADQRGARDTALAPGQVERQLRQALGRRRSCAPTWCTSRARRSSFWAPCPAIVGVGLMVRWAYLYFRGTLHSHTPSVVGAAVLLILAFLLWVLGLLGEVLAINRRLLQDVQYRVRKVTAERAANGSGANGA